MRSAFLGLLVVGLAGCLLPAPPAPPRYFTADTGDPIDPAASRPVAVRLAPVHGPLYLREQMTWRRSEEFGFYEQRRWAELPSTYVERALARELFAAEREPPSGASAGPLVVAEVRAFEEVLAPAHEARVAIAVTVVDGSCVRLRRTFAASRPLSGDDPTATARGIGEALDEVAHAAAGAVRGAVERRDRCGA